MGGSFSGELQVGHNRFLAGAPQNLNRQAAKLAKKGDLRIFFLSWRLGGFSIEIASGLLGKSRTHSE
jgi:hypothetical protein